LSNTTEKERDLLLDDRVVQLANAVIDVRQPEPAVPAALRAPADSGTWIVVARHPLDQAFRSALQAAGASVMSYIPNNAELVRASSEVVLALKGNALVESVLPYHPYYKLTDPRLLALAVNGQDLPGDVGLRLSLYQDSATTTLAALQGLRAEVGTPEPSPFGTEVTVHPAPGTFLQIAQLDGVMDVEATHARLAANDMMRTVLGVATNAVTNLNYLNLTGANVVFGVADSDVDATHPDLAGRLVLDSSATGMDTNGHGTHVIGTMIGNGSKSSTVGTNASGSVTNANFRGIAPAGTAMVMSIPVDTRPRAADAAPASDALIQETMGASNVSLVNLSWYYYGDTAYDMSAASYDAAVRDSIPELTGPQAIPYIIAAGNSGGANPDGTGGIGDSINSPGTSKNAITVGAEEELRNITNIITKDGEANSIFVAETDSSNQVSDISSRGNVGIGIEGGAGRFKPDVIAPGVFTVSTASQQMNQ
jgi:subtilisin family serine protease